MAARWATWAIPSSREHTVRRADNSQKLSAGHSVKKVEHNYNARLDCKSSAKTPFREQPDFYKVQYATEDTNQISGSEST